jgi:hypothetical protein
MLALPPENSSRLSYFMELAGWSAVIHLAAYFSSEIFSTFQPLVHGSSSP